MEALWDLRCDPAVGATRLKEALQADLSQMDAPGASAATPSAEVTPSEERLQRNFPQEAPPLPASSRPEPTAPDASPLLIPPNRSKRRTADARGRRPGRFVKRREPHPEALARRSRRIRPRTAANSTRGTATCVRWQMTCRAWDTTLAPISTGLSRGVVSYQPRLARSSANGRRKFARSYASPDARAANALDTGVDTSSGEGSAPQNMT
jgi:hypothetical protein